MAQTANTTVVGVFRDEADARQVVNDLVNAGIPRERIQFGSKNDWMAGPATGGAGLTGQSPQHHSGFMGWLESLFGEDNQGRDYTDAVNKGNCVVSVDASGPESDRAMEIMERRGAIDIGQNESQTVRGNASSPVRPETDERSIPVVQEELEVGKRPVQRGGVRVYTRTKEQPVEQQVTLRDEQVRVQRRPVNQPVNPGDQAVLSDQTIEVLETSEEPVVAKRARVVEEVVVDKQSSQRTETVRDTVRRQEVEVEKMNPGSRPSGATAVNASDEDFRTDFNRRYAGSGANYDTYAPAYEYGFNAGNDSRYRGRAFDQIEKELQTDYLRRNPNSSWDEIRGAVRYGWERVTGQR